MQFWTCSQKSSEAHDITPGPQSIVTWKVMSRTKLYEINYWNYSCFTLVKWNWNWRAAFFKNPPDGAGHSLKCIESKNRQHFHFKNFLIRCILDYAQRHLVDFWKKRPANFNFIWLEWNSYNSSIQIHIVWSRSSIFKLKSSPAQGWYLKSKIFF